MGYIHCCGALHKTRSYRIAPQEGYCVCELDVLNLCPVCGSKIVQLTRVTNDDKIKIIRKTNAKGEKFFEKLKNKILYEIKIFDYSKAAHSSFYLNYNEYGIQKRCYSNLSVLKIGKIDSCNL